MFELDFHLIQWTGANKWMAMKMDFAIKGIWGENYHFCNKSTFFAALKKISLLLRLVPLRLKTLQTNFHLKTVLESMS